MREYIPGEKLNVSEYLLKIRPNDNIRTSYPTGFLSKLTKKGELQKSFDEWPAYWNIRNVEKLPVYIVSQNFVSGWKLIHWRFGQSQNWASLLHPDGYTLEVYLDDFLDTLKNNTIVNGEILGEFRWEKNKLIKK